MKIHNRTITDIVFVALFASITFAATNIQIPMPALIGKPFVHLGNSSVLLSVFLLGYKRGSLAGGIGLGLFDMLNGYIAEAPYYFFECFIVGGAAVCCLKLVKYTERSSKLKLIIVILSAIVTKLLMTTGHNFIISLIKGMTLKPAVMATISAIFPTMINCITTGIIVFALHDNLARQFEKIAIANHVI